MKVTREKTENSQVFLTIEMEPSEMQESMDEAFHHLSQRAKIPGFRKGKIPREIFDRYFTKDDLLRDVMTHLIPEAYEKAVKQEGIKPFANPDIEIIQTEPIAFKAAVPLYPEIKLGDYKQVRVVREAVKVTEDEINEAMEQLRHQHATWESVERPVQYNDLASVDIESTEGGQPFINRKGIQYHVVKERPYPLPGFAEQLPGTKRDEEKEFTLKVPADFGRKDLADKEVYFKIKVTEIKQEVLQELNDDFAKAISPELASLSALREEVVKRLQQAAEEKAHSDYEGKVVDEVVKISQVEFPPVLVAHETDHLIEREMRRWAQAGLVKDFESYLKLMNKTEAQLREELRPEATKRVTQSLVLGKVAEVEKVEATETEIKDSIDMLVSDAAEARDKARRAFDTPDNRESVKNSILTVKTVELLEKIAGGSAESSEKEKEEKK